MKPALASTVSTAAAATTPVAPPLRADAVANAGSMPNSLPDVVKRVLRLMSPQERRRLALLSGPVVLAAVLEAVGVASIIPFLGLLSDPNAIDNSQALRWAYDAVGATSRERFFFLVGALVLVTMTLSNATQALSTYSLLRFSWMRNHTLSVRLLESYLHRPYTFFVQHNTSDLAKNILSEVQQVVTGVVVQGLHACARLAVVALIGASLLFVDPLMAVGVTVLFGGLYGVIYMSVRRTLTRLGFERVDANAERFKVATEILSGIKELKLLGLERSLLGSYARPSEMFADRMAKNATLGALPKHALETVAFGGVLVITLYMLWNGHALEGVLPVLGLYAFAAYRMLPAVQVVFIGVTTIRFNLAALNALAKNIEDALAEEPPPDREPAPLPFERGLAMRGVRYRYAGAARDALDAVDLTLKRGEWIALVGPTGSGKTTLADVVLGLLAPDSGAFEVDGGPVVAASLRAWQRNVGYVPQQIFLVDDSVRRNIAFGIPEAEIDDARVAEAARVAQIADFIERDLPGGYGAAVGERGVRISGGQRQRLGIARALYRRPALLVLDEATSALDGATEASFLQAVRAALTGSTVISIAHRLSTTASFDRVLLVDGGRVVAEGRPQDAIDGAGPFAVLHKRT